jgi:hypothetical protein
MLTRFGAALLIGALALSPALSLAADDDSALETAIEKAETPAQHTELAQQYRAKAAEARAMAETHQRMGGRYQGKYTSMRDHCVRISKKYAGIAEDYDALAKGEEEAAKAD